MVDVCVHASVYTDQQHFHGTDFVQIVVSTFNNLMFPISTLFKNSHFQGYIFDILGAWAGIVFICAAECEISFVIFSEMNDVGGYSGDDPACVGIVQSIEVHPWHPRHVLCYGSHHSSSLCCPEHSE